MSKKSVGILLDKISPSELCFDISRLTIENTGDDILVFFTEPGRPYQDILCPQINICDLYSYYGSVVATSINTARRAIQSITPYEIIFYPHDLDWLRIPTFAYEQLREVYTHPLLTKYCRSESHQEIIEKCFGVKYEIVESWGKIIEKAKPARSYLDDCLKINQFAQGTQDER